MILFQCKIIVHRHSSKKNEKVTRKRGNHFFIAKSDKAKSAEDWMIYKLSQLKCDTITCDINAKYVFYFPKSKFYTKKNTRNKKLNDLSNLLELPSDILQKVKIIEDDYLICSFDGSCRKSSQDENYYLEIVLTNV